MSARVTHGENPRTLAEAIDMHRRGKNLSRETKNGKHRYSPLKDQRRRLCREHGITTGRQWRKLRQAIRRGEIAI